MGVNGIQVFKVSLVKGWMDVKVNQTKIALTIDRPEVCFLYFLVSLPTLQDFFCTIRKHNVSTDAEPKHFEINYIFQRTNLLSVN